MELSLRWAERSQRAFAQHGASPARRCSRIVQGGTDAELRRRSAEALVGMDFPGYAVGGLAVGEGQELMLATLDGVAAAPAGGQAALPDGRRHAGRPHRGGARAASTCSTACCRRATAATASPSPGTAASTCATPGTPRIRPRSIRESACPAARDYSRAYLHHLVKSGEYLGAMLLSWVNTAFYQELMAAMRAAIAEGRFAAWAEETQARASHGRAPRL